MAPSLRQHRRTPEDRFRGRVATAVLVFGVVFIVGWIAAVTALAGRGGESGQREPEGGDGESETRRRAVSANAPPEARGGSDSRPTGEHAARSSHTEEAGGDQPPASGDADSGQSVADEADTAQVFDSLERRNEPPDAATDGPTRSNNSRQGGPIGGVEPPRTAAKQPARASPRRDDPVGGVETRGPGATESARARAASERYVAAAYGYSGSSAGAYLEGIERAATEEVYGSPGGRKLKGYSRAAPECGMRSTAGLEGFELLDRGPRGLDVAVVFSVEDADGQTHLFRQYQRLVSSEDAYEVSGASVEELISDTTPSESCPGAGSKDAANGEGGAEQEVPERDLPPAGAKKTT